MRSIFYKDYPTSYEFSGFDSFLDAFAREDVKSLLRLSDVFFRNSHRKPVERPPESVERDS